MATKPDAETTTITIRKSTMQELKTRAVAEDMRYSDYLEQLIHDHWRRDKPSSKGRTAGTDKAGKR